ncbi:TolC family protein [Sphingomonas sp. CGMCC 1.13654]|uniref:TolC family protein n=1 Tax=Sphingomonas chungangi TaxID=2683589 RepID=A0A838LBS7_9SPHN|nr:TolC family protein [Sphingomonas chungangi]MBA2934938.1 TolC family protein [Sphingomonas chungangi]MVW58249.1 efflux transporter outer membrane subunit [Sphingomonas chungangi]
MMRLRSPLAVLPALALAACAVGPNYKPPVVQADAKQPFVEGQASTMLSGQPLPDKWWEMFQDPALDRLIQDAFAYNTDIRVAAGNLRKARGVLSEARAGRLPTTDLSAGYNRIRVGADSDSAGTATGGSTTTVPTGGGNGPSHYDFNYYQAGFDASYEVDLFGRVSRSIEASRGDAAAAQAALDGARISIAAQVAQSYADACGYAAQADVARETARLQGNTRDLTQRLLDAGRGTRRDVDQAEVTVEQAKAQVPQLEGERRAQLYALAALTGRPPAEIDGDASACRIVPKVKTVIPVGDGATLLARRPDVREAERTLAADTARIGVATAALFPSVTLAGSLSLGAPHIGDIGKSASFGYSVGPLISWTFPNIAVATAKIRQARGQTDASLASFQGTVLTALKETEQALARYSAALDQNAALARAAAAADDAAKLSRIRFDTGRDNFLNLLVSEQDRASARSALAQSDQQVADAQVSLFKALGGGWENAPPIANAAPGAVSGNPSVQRGSFAVPVSQKGN